MIKNLTFKKVLLFTFPSIIALLFMSFYTMVDGAFVSNLISQDAFASINIVLPVILSVGAIGLMIGTGGNAIYSKLLGEGKQKEAKQKFSLFTFIGVIASILFIIVVIIFKEQILTALGTNENLYAYANDYLTIYVMFTPFIMLQMILQTALISCNRPGLSLIAMLVGGVTNIILDYVCIAIFNMGISGAALATGLGNTFGAAIGILYFTTNVKSKPLYFTTFQFDYPAILKMCGNGSSEMVTSLSSSLITFLFNQVALQLAGNDGLAAVTVVMYVQLFATSLFMGYATGISPLISFNYGEKNATNLRKLFKYSLYLIGVSSLAMLIITYFIADPLSSFFLEPNSLAHTYSVQGIRLFMYALLFAGFNIFTSALFTAYSNGKISATISFLRTFLFLAISILTLPSILGLTGLWIATPVAECLAILLTIYFIHKYKTKYMYNSCS